LVSFWEGLREERRLEQPHPSDEHYAEIEAEAKAEESAALLRLGELASEYGIAAVARERGLSHEAVRKWVAAWERAY